MAWAARISAREIGKVTETITDNLSPDQFAGSQRDDRSSASRAGAVKGFVAVANENEAPAQRTATAEEDIKARGAGAQDATADGIVEIEKVPGAIGEVSDIVTSIAAWVSRGYESEREDNPDI